MGSVTRNVAHLLSGLRSGSGGVAWLRVLCPSSYSYGASGYINGFFPYPLQNNNPQNWDVVVVAHELGHNFDAIHTHEMSPPVDCCGGAYGGNCGGVQNCASPVPANQGTIMSYCHICPGGVANIVLTLQTRVISERILPYLNGAADACLLRDPAITQQPQSQTRCVGQSVTFSVTASGAAPLSYQWRLNGANIGGATSSSYTIASVTTGHAGNYDCVVTNAPACSVTSNAVTLMVGTSPSITQHPADAMICSGQSHQFCVTASGSGPSYQWQRDGSDIPSATASCYTATLAGSYRCVVTNPCGSATSNAATLTVYPTGSGDGNGDGMTNGADIQGFVNAVITGGPPSAAYCAYDMNGNGAVDAADIPLFVTMLVNP